MSRGIAYDSDEGRELASEITSYMTAISFQTSVEMAKELGPFKEWEKNRGPMVDILEFHRELSPLKWRHYWEEVLMGAKIHGVRNCMTTLIAPTGTISFMMDATTTGIEPELSLVKYKTLVGDGCVKIINGTVKKALSALGYDEEQIRRAIEHISLNGSLETWAILQEKDRPVFDCSLKSEFGERCLSPEAHLSMMAAVQPFLSGAISKTVNLPCDTTVEQIEELIVMAYKMGLKAVTFYRDNCKESQPLSVVDPSKKMIISLSSRKKLPTDCKSFRHKFSVNGMDGYLHVGLYDDGSVGEVFVTISKAGSTISGLVDTVAILTSFALQHGVPLRDLVKKLSHVKFEPSGFTGNPDIPMAKSLVDYLFRYLGHAFLEKEVQEDIGLVEGKRDAHSDAPVCPSCGDLMVRSGHCYICRNCGDTSGCS
jgi:ribonucleoside-diphosphate reductase alpha chain